MQGPSLSAPSAQGPFGSRPPAAGSGPVPGAGERPGLTHHRPRPRARALLLGLLTLCLAANLAAEVTLTEVGHWGSGPYQAVAVDGHYAYAATGPTGLDIIHISNPAAPVRVGGYETGTASAESAYGVAVVGGMPLSRTLMANC